MMSHFAWTHQYEEEDEFLMIHNFARIGTKIS